MYEGNIDHSLKSEIKENLSISIPLVFTQLFESSSSFIIMIMIAYLGQTSLAALPLVGMCLVSLNSFFYSVLRSMSILISHQLGGNNFKAIGEIMRAGFVLVVVISIFCIFCLVYIPRFLYLTGQPSVVIDLATQFAHSSAWGIPAALVMILYNQFLLSMHKAKIVLKFSIMITCSQVLLSYLLIYGKFGLPQYGIRGLGYGSAISVTVFVFLLTFYLIKSQIFKEIEVFKKFTIDTYWIKEIVSQGLPLGLMGIVHSLAFTVATFFMARFGTTVLAAHQIVLQCTAFAFSFIVCMSQAGAARLSYEVGQQDKQGVHLALLATIILDTLLALCFVILFNLIPYNIISLVIDTSNPENAHLVHIATILLCIGSITIIGDNFSMIGLGVLRSLKDVQFPLYAFLISYFGIGLVTAGILIYACGFQGTGVWWGLAFASLFSAGLYSGRVYLILKKFDLAKIMRR